VDKLNEMDDDEEPPIKGSKLICNMYKYFILSKKPIHELFKNSIQECIIISNVGDFEFLKYNDVIVDPLQMPFKVVNIIMRTFIGEEKIVSTDLFSRMS